MDRKRRLPSCTTCRRLKTRCDYEVSEKKCHRCRMLHLQCSLTATRGNHEPEKDKDLLNIDNRLEIIEKSVGEMKCMLEKFNLPCHDDDVDIQTRDSLLEELDAKNEYAPMSIIRNLDYKIFARNEIYEPMEEGARDLVLWIKQWPQYCHRLSSIFLQKCSRYVIRHSVGNCSPLLLGVMTLQGMRMDVESTHDALQRQLFPLVRSLLSVGLMTSPLRHDDIEAMMYMAHFNVARKPVQPIFDSWLLTGYAVKLYMLSVQFADIVNRAQSTPRHTTEHDLYLFRLWNGLCQCHLQYAVESARKVMIPRDYLAQCSKIVLLDGASVIDGVTVAEIKLLSQMSEGDVTLIRQWHMDSLPLFPMDDSKSLTLAYYNALLIATNRPGISLSEGATSFIISCCKEIITAFLGLTPEIIDAMPNHPLCILIYACLLLCQTNCTDDRENLALLTKVYWYIAHLGVHSRDITHSIANIIKSIIENSKNIKLDALTVISPASSTEVKLEKTSSPDHQDPPPMSKTVPVSAGDQISPGTVVVDSMANSMDLSQYASYDDFVERMFSMV